MPTYFGEIAPHCPISKDQPTGLMKAPLIRTNIPRVVDLASAIAAANMLKSLIDSLVLDRVINNVYTPPTPAPRVQPGDQVINKQRKSSWSENTTARVKRKYKYYLKEKDGTEDRDVWVMTERMEQMVWVDRGWKTGMVFTYGEKGEGEPVNTGISLDPDTGDAVGIGL